MAYSIKTEFTWGAAAHIAIMAIENGNAKGRQSGIDTITDMASKLDELNAEIRKDTAKKIVNEKLKALYLSKDLWSVVVHDLGHHRERPDTWGFEIRTTEGEAVAECNYWTVDPKGGKPKSYDSDLKLALSESAKFVKI